MPHVTLFNWFDHPLSRRGSSASSPRLPTLLPATTVLRRIRRLLDVLNRHDLDPLRRAVMVKTNGLPVVDELTLIARTDRHEVN